MSEHHYYTMTGLLRQMFFLPIFLTVPALLFAIFGHKKLKDREADGDGLRVPELRP